MKLPDFRLKIMNKKRNTQNKDAGAGWVNPNGSVSIVINPGVILNDNPEHIITLFPIDRTKEP